MKNILTVRTGEALAHDLARERSLSRHDTPERLQQARHERFFSEPFSAVARMRRGELPRIPR